MKKSTVYQFPMGKVKSEYLETLNCEHEVSIPNGKGKGEIYARVYYPKALYQFPMGKIKTITLASTRGPKMNVSIPNGKGKAFTK